MRKSFTVTHSYTAMLDDWIVIIRNSKGEDVYTMITESWDEWGEYGLVDYGTLSPEYIESRKQAVISHAIELYINSFD